MASARGIPTSAKLPGGISVALVDYGGGTRRTAIGLVGLNSVAIEAPTVSTVRFTDVDSFLRDACSIKPVDGQSAIIISVAGPTDPTNRVLLKYTNQAGEEPLVNIPLAECVEAQLHTSKGKHYKIAVVNDGLTTAVAEKMSGGALSNLQVGALGLGLIIGNGVGGRVFQRAEYEPRPKTDFPINWALMACGIKFIHGGFEIGHQLIDRRWVRASRYMGVLERSNGGFKCGCGLTSDKEICVDAAAKGPTLEKLLRAKLYEYNNNGKTNSLKPFLACLLKRRPDLVENSGWIAHVNNEDLKAVMQATDGENSIGKSVMRAEAEIIARGIAILQRGYNNHGLLTVAVTSGIGFNFAPWLVPALNQATERLPRSQWGHRSLFVPGLSKPDETNLIGAAWLAGILSQVGV